MKQKAKAITLTMVGVFYPVIAGLFWDAFLLPLKTSEVIMFGSALTTFFGGAFLLFAIVDAWMGDE